MFYARSLHKYDGNTFHHIDPQFGPDPAGDFALMAQETSDPKTWHWTAADKLFLEMLRQAHARGIRVIIDGVFNHTGRDFFAFADLREKQDESPYKDWYIVQSFDDPSTPQNEFRYRGWWGVETLPEFADDGQRQRSARGAEAVRVRHHRALDGPGWQRRSQRRHRWLAARRGERSAGRILERLARARPRHQSGCVHGRRSLGRREPVSRRRPASRRR